MFSIETSQPGQKWLKRQLPEHQQRVLGWPVARVTPPALFTLTEKGYGSRSLPSVNMLLEQDGDIASSTEDRCTPMHGQGGSSLPLGYFRFSASSSSHPSHLQFSGQEISPSLIRSPVMPLPELDGGCLVSLVHSRPRVLDSNPDTGLLYITLSAK